jgi:NTP pyrophosphatase (non-canonical NTP hydrolase)
MRFEDYQKRAMDTNRLGSQDPLTVALYGLAGETGSIHTLYKKRLRDGDRFTGFQAKVKEELGDILWYLTAIASLEGLSLQEIAVQNIEKTTSRWLPTGEDDWVDFDEHFPPNEQLPRKFTAQFVASVEDGVSKVEVLIDGERLGAKLNDNSYVPDGYRFHDIFHMTCVALLGWSPVVRALLKRKRKSDKETDDVEDGGRAIVIDEALVALVFAYAIRHTYLEEIKVLDWQLLDLCHELTSSFEVGKRSLYEWEQTILKTFEIWREVQTHGGGWVRFDRDMRSVEFSVTEPRVTSDR